MMAEQSLPTYTHAFKNDRRWKSFSSVHYILHYFAGSEAESDLKKIVETQELAYKKIMAFLELPDPGRPIEYFFYPDAQTKKLLMGDDWYAQAIFKEFCVHVLYTKNDKPLGEHEDTHLLSLPWGLSIGFFQEGLAEFMVGNAWDGRTHESYIKEGYIKGLYLPLTRYLKHDAWLKIDDNNPLYYYSLAGAFTTFLIGKYGRDKFKVLYQKTRRDLSREDNERIFTTIYGPITKVEQMFKDTIS